MRIGLLLTGGRSTRMGMPKASLRREGTSLVESVGQAMAPWCDRVIEIGPSYGSGDYTSDAGRGPLAAIDHGWRYATNVAAPAMPVEALVCSVDLPHLESRDLGALYGVDLDRFDAVIPTIAGRSQPLIARYGPAAFVLAGELLEMGERSMMALTKRLNVAWVEIVAPGTVRAFSDVDTPDDAERAGVDLDGNR